MDEYLQRAKAVFARINELAEISEDKTGITRTFGTVAFLKGSQKVFGWMQQAGLQTRVDAIGNVRGRLISNNPQAKTFVIASHIDTVIHAGKFDGPLGVLAGLDLVENLIRSKQQLPFHIELIAFSDEEGVRFHTTYLGSKVLAGSFDETLLSKTDANFITLKEALETISGDPNEFSNDAIKPEDCLGYFEIHIEQGPVLYENKIPVAIVTAIAGQKRIEMTFTGMAGHAGTVPMKTRQDALACAAEFILAAEAFALQEGLVVTIGKLEVPNSASNVIPGKVICTLDVRCADDEKLDFAYHQLKNQAQTIASKRNINLNWNLIQETKAVTCDAELMMLLKEAINLADYPLVELVSGAGHDAVPISTVAPVSMLFVRCFKGISHHPLENAELGDVAAALQVSDQFLQNLIKKYAP